MVGLIFFKTVLLFHAAFLLQILLSHCLPEKEEKDGNFVSRVVYLKPKKWIINLL